MKQKNLLVLVGPPGCGKTTWADKFAEENNALHVSRDRIRFSLIKENNGYFSKEDKVFKIFCDTIRKGLESDEYDYVIADATHLNQVGRYKLLSSINYTPDINLIAVEFHTPLDVCLSRNSLREGRACVPVAVVRRMFSSFVSAKNDENYHFNEVWSVNENGELTK